MTDLEIIEKVLDEKVRPQLSVHGGDLETIGYEDGIYRFRTLGACSGCPSASLHTEYVVQEELSKVLPGLKGVELDSGITQEMWDQAMEILKRSREKKAEG